LTLKLVGLLLGQLAKGATAAQLATLPTGLSTLVSQQAALANRMGRNEPIFDEDDEHSTPPLKFKSLDSILFQQSSSPGSTHTQLNMPFFDRDVSLASLSAL
jgi:hypothetical protein